MAKIIDTFRNESGSEVETAILTVMQTSPNIRVRIVSREIYVTPKDAVKLIASLTKAVLDVDCQLLREQAVI